MKLRSAAAILGQGAFLGAVAGCAVGSFEVGLQADIEHGHLRLAVLRVFEVLPWFTAGAVLLSIALALLHRAVERRGRLPRLIAPAGAAASVLLAFLVWRDVAFPRLAYFDSYPVRSLAVFSIVGLCGIGLVLLRSWKGGAEGRIGRSAAWVGLAALPVALLGTLAANATGTAVSRGRPSVILVSIDTLRADRLSCLGAERALTPNLDRMASEGALFEHAISAAPWTLPSHASIFLSRLPFDHGVRWTSKVLSPSRPTLAELFRQAGYRTAAFTAGGFVAGRFGLDQGFESYAERLELREGASPEGTFEEATRWIDGMGSRPYFLFLHTYEPHAPYTHADFATPQDAGRLPGKLTIPMSNDVLDGKVVLTAGERRYVRDLYDGDVRSADRLVGSFLDGLRSRGILDRTIVVVLSDHGEELWDREPNRSPGHGHSLYEELTHVPLLVRWPGRVPAGLRISTPVSLIDVAPTLLALAELPPSGGHLGRSLAREVTSASEPAVHPVFSESIEYGTDRFAARVGPYKAIHAPSPEVFIRDVRLGGHAWEIFDLAADPDERTNLAGRAGAGERPAVESVLGRVLAKRIGGEKAPEEGPLPQEVLDQLRALGYIR